MSWYVGIYPGRERPRIFFTTTKPTERTYPEFERVIGPFSSNTLAREYVDLRISRTNPGAEYHRIAFGQARHSRDAAKGAKRDFFLGQAFSEARSYRESLDRGMSSNPPHEDDDLVEVYDDIHAIEARKGKNSYWPGENFRHDFTKRKTPILGVDRSATLELSGGRRVRVPAGSLLVPAKKGRRLFKQIHYRDDEVGR